jgi:hypothetical protein
VLDDDPQAAGRDERGGAGGAPARQASAAFSAVGDGGAAGSLLLADPDRVVEPRRFR